MNRSGSTFSTGQSKSIPSSNTSGSATGASGVSAWPRATRAMSAPSAPRRTATPPAGSASNSPVSRTLPYQWFDTPNLRYATIYDFKDLAEKCGLEVLEYVALAEGKPVSFLPNLRGSLAVFRLRKRDLVSQA